MHSRRQLVREERESVRTSLIRLSSALKEKGDIPHKELHWGKHTLDDTGHQP